MDWIRKNPVTAGLLGLSAVLLVVIGFETGWGTAIRKPVAVGEPPKVALAEARILPGLQVLPAEQAAPESAARPLFIATRRPAPAAQAAAASMQKGQYTLHGVTIVGDLRIALLRDKAGKTHRIEQGKDFNGVTVATIEPEKVTLKQGEDSEEVALLVQKAGGAGAVAPPSAPLPTSGPFGGPPAAAPPPGAVPAGAPAVPGQPARPTPAMPTPRTGGTTAPAGSPRPGEPPAAGSALTNPTATLTPEELMARRRARRAQQAQ